MSKGFAVTIASYALFIVLPFLYLLTSVHTLLTNDTKVVAKVEKQQYAENKRTMHIYQS